MTTQLLKELGLNDKVNRYYRSTKQLQRGPCLTPTFLYDKDADESDDEFESRTYEVNNLAKVRFNCNYDDGKLELSLSAKKLETAKDFSVEIKITSEELQCSEQLLIHTLEWSKWRSLGTAVHVSEEEYYGKDDNMQLFMIRLDVVASKVKASNVIGKIYLDDDFIDFHLTAADGSVGVHKVYLAALSDVFKRMLKGKWKEAKEGCVELEGITQKDLQHFKEYLYLGNLPDDGLRPLLLLARYFLIDDLKEECIQKIVDTITPKNLYELLEFACKNNLPELTFGILNLTPDKTIHSAYKINNK